MYTLIYIPKGISPPIKRSDLEYVTEEVPLEYLHIIGKAIQFAWHGELDLYDAGLLTSDFLTDKAIWGFICQGVETNTIMARVRSQKNWYCIHLYPPETSKDIWLLKDVDGEHVIIGSYDIDIYEVTGWVAMMLSASGDILNVYGEFIVDLSGNYNTYPWFSATDTSHPEGRFGLAFVESFYVERNIALMGYLTSPKSNIPKPQAIIEYNIKEDYSTRKGKKIIKPDMPEELVEVDKNMVTPDEWKAVQANPKGANGLPLVDRLAVSWGAIDYRGEPTMLVAVYGGSPSYVRGDAVARHIEYARGKGLKVYKPPRSPSEARELYKQIRSDRPDMLITENELVYQLIGARELEPDAIADFYERELLNLNRIRNVPTWELDRTLRRWERVAEKYKRGDALRKLRKVRKK